VSASGSTCPQSLVAGELSLYTQHDKPLASPCLHSNSSPSTHRYLSVLRKRFTFQIKYCGYLVLVLVSYQRIWVVATARRRTLWNQQTNHGPARLAYHHDLLLRLDSGYSLPSLRCHGLCHQGVFLGSLERLANPSHPQLLPRLSSGHQPLVLPGEDINHKIFS